MDATARPHTSRGKIVSVSLPRVVKDKNGKVIHEFDVLKVFHFIGARRKKHYMYKWVRINPKYPHFLFGCHLEKDDLFTDAYVLNSSSQEGEIVIEHAEVIQSLHD